MFVCRVPKSSEEFSRVLRVEQDLFGALSIPPSTSHEIFKTFPEIYTAIFDSNGVVAAYSSGYPLKQKWAEAFIAGQITEPELEPSMLLRKHDCLDGAYVYIGSVVVRTYYDPFIKAALLAGLLSWRIKQLQASSIKRISAIMTPVTEGGLKLIHYAGARKLNDGTNRKDGYPVYGCAISSTFLLRASATIERCLSSCCIQFSDEAHLTPETDKIAIVPGPVGHPVA